MTQIANVDVDRGLVDFQIKDLKRHVSGVDNAAPITMFSGNMVVEGEVIEASVIGTSQDLPALLNLAVDSGRFLSAYDADQLFAVVGKDVQAAPKNSFIGVGSQLQIAGYLISVVGVLDHQDNNPFVPIDIDKSVFLHSSSIKRFKSPANVDFVVVKAYNAGKIEHMTPELGSFFEKLVTPNKVTVLLPRTLLEGLKRQAKTFSSLLAALGTISLLVGGVGVMNVMLMSVSERKREIGVRMAMGARSRDIGLLFLLESVLLSSIGALVGTFCGVALALLFVRLSGWDYTFYSPSIFLGAGSSLLLGLIFGITPALKAARMEPLEALRDE